jgi:hypothetical protein
LLSPRQLVGQALRGTERRFDRQLVGVARRQELGRCERSVAGPDLGGRQRIYFIADQAFAAIVRFVRTGTKLHLSPLLSQVRPESEENRMKERESVKTRDRFRNHQPH